MVDVYVFGLVVGVIVALAGMWILWQYAPEWVARRLKDSEVLSVIQIEDYVDKMDWHYAKGDGVKKDPVELPVAGGARQNGKPQFPVAYPIKYPTDADVKVAKKAAKDLRTFASKKKAASKKTKATSTKKKALTAKKKTSKRA